MHAPAAFIDSLDHSKVIIDGILWVVLMDSQHLFQPFHADLAKATGRPDWYPIENVEIPCHPQCLSHATDEASYNDLIAEVTDTHLKDLALSSTVCHAGDWLNVAHSNALSHHLQAWEF